MLVANLAAACYSFGLRERGDTLFVEVRRIAPDGHVSGGAFVLIHLARGETGEAVEWLRHGRANGDGFLRS